MATITQLQYVVAVDRAKHFGRAAEECHVSQPSLSAQVQKVEEELDIIIFDRSKKPILVTDNGKKVIAQAKKILQEYEKIFEIRGGDGPLVGDFHLGVIPTLSSSVIPMFIENFSRDYPEVRLRISEYKTEDIIRLLEDDQLDGGLLVTPLKEERIIERRLFLEPFYAFVSGEHGYAKRKFLSSEELSREDLWILHEGHCFRNQVLNICSAPASHPSFGSVKFESGSLETLINLIRQGKGYTLLPHLSTQNLTKAEREKNLKSFRSPVPTREVSLVHSRSFLKEEIIDALVEVITESLPNELVNLKKQKTQIIDI